MSRYPNKRMMFRNGSRFEFANNPPEGALTAKAPALEQTGFDVNKIERRCDDYGEGSLRMSQTRTKYKPKSCLEMEYEEFVDWACGHILKELIGGSFRSAVWLVIDQAIRRGQQEAQL